MKRLLSKVRRVWKIATHGVARIASRSRFASAFYYFLFDHSFWREQHAVLNGRTRFAFDSRVPEGSSALLRRNIHRLEKGLIARPRREVFALDYIEETVAVYGSIVSCGCQHDFEELAWAHDVLVEYFRVSAQHPKLACLREVFAEMCVVQPVPVALSPNRNEKRIPYARAAVQSVVSYSDLLSLARHRRSVRWFQQVSVPREMILKAVEVATLSPSACNRQPYEFRVFDDPDLVRQVAALPAGAIGYGHNFPCVIVVVGKQRYYFDERDRHLIYIDGAMASMALILALETLGLSSCCINWPDIEIYERAADELLNLASDERPIMFIAVGYPDPAGLIPYSEKRTSQQLCQFNQS